MVKKEKNNTVQTPKYRFTVRDLIIIAVLCSIGGGMSTFVKYISNIINVSFGVPFGAAQLVAGLHVLWLVLCFGFVRKIGTGTMAGVLKGIIELFTGNPWGITVVLISTIEGGFIDIGMTIFRKKHAIYSYGIAAGFAAASEVFVFYPLFLPSMPFWFVLATGAIAFGSGLVFGGFFGTGTLELMHVAKVAKIPNWNPPKIDIESSKKISKSLKKMNEKGVVRPILKPNKKLFYISTLVFITFFIVGGVIYFITVPELFSDHNTCEVEGNVSNPYTYSPHDFENQKSTIKTDLKGSAQYEGEQEYTGVPLHIIINQSKPNQNITKIQVIASDGYNWIFQWSNVKSDDELILIEEDNSLRLIAGKYTLTHCVRNVDRIVIE